MRRGLRYEYLLLAAVTSLFAILLGAASALPLLEYRLKLPSEDLLWLGALVAVAVSTLSLALGTRYPFDAQLPWPALTRRLVLWRIEPGAVIILHDVGERGERTARVLEKLLPELNRRGFRVVSLSELEGPAPASEARP